MESGIGNLVGASTLAFTCYGFSSGCSIKEGTGVECPLQRGSLFFLITINLSGMDGMVMVFLG